VSPVILVQALCVQKIDMCHGRVCDFDGDIVFQACFGIGDMLWFEFCEILLCMSVNCDTHGWRIRAYFDEAIDLNRLHDEVVCKI
jgi:hypothetical protein